MAEKTMKDQAELKQKLTPEQYHVTQEAGTECAFTGAYWNTKDAGMYHCVVCGAPLFDSQTKFNSGTGWPSFTKPANGGGVVEHKDSMFGMVRTEVRCATCDAHLKARPNVRQMLAAFQNAARKGAGHRTARATGQTWSQKISRNR